MYKEITEERNPALPKWRSSSVYIAFAGLALLAYFPLWSLMMAIKNDALVLSYPLFQYFSAQLSSGSVPWWHYNIHLGFPLHADPGFPFWSPITWAFALFGGTVYHFTFLLLFYIMVAGFGMIGLLKRLGSSSATQVTGALLYVVSGYFVSHLEHPHYIFEIAFIPFCLNFFFSICHQPNVKDSVRLAISVFFLVNSGYPSFAISAVYFFFFLFVLCIGTDNKLRNATHLRAVLLHFIIALSVAVVLCLPYLCSVIEFYPHFNRGGPLKEENTLTGGFTLKSLISVFFPLASVADRSFFNTQISWNNIYFGSIALGLSVYGLTSVRHRIKLPLIIAGVILLLLSFQGPIKVFFFKVIPLFDHIHTNGGLRIYFVLAMIVIAMLCFDSLSKLASPALMRKIIVSLAAVYLVGALLSLLTTGVPDFSASLASALKSLSVSNAIFIQSIVSIIILIAAFVVVKKPAFLLLLIAAEATTAFYINLPYTGLSINRTTMVQQHLDSIRAVTAATRSFELTSYPNKDRFFRDTALFSSPIAFLQPGSYPSGIRSYFSFLEQGGEATITRMQTVSCIHSLRNDENHLRLSNIVPNGNSISIEGEVAIDDTLVVTQNNYPGWRYTSSAGTGRPLSTLGTFMTFPVKKGIVAAKLRYTPSGVLYCVALSIFAWIFSCIILVKRKHNVHRNS